jgi:hypothetical protein
MLTLARAKHDLQGGVVFTGTQENAAILGEVLDVKVQPLLRTTFAAADQKKWFLPHDLAAAEPRFRALMDNGSVVVDGADQFIDHAEKGPNPRGTIYAHTQVHATRALTL